MHWLPIKNWSKTSHPLHFLQVGTLAEALQRAKGRDTVTWLVTGGGQGEGRRFEKKKCLL